MVLVGRDVELEELARALDRAGAGHGGVLVVTGPRGAGKTALADAAVDLAHGRGFRVLRGGGPLVWAQVARDLGVPDEVVAPLLGEPGPLELDDVARRLVSPDRTVVVVDDVDRAGPAAVALLAVRAGRVGAGRTVVVATATTSLDTGRELRIGGLAEDELAAVLPSSNALWVASRGLPGVAHRLAALDGTGDPIVTMALNALSANEFLDIDVALVRLLELAVPRAPDDPTRARVLARLARELVGDASARDRRHDLVTEALRLAGDDPSASADVLDARLSACWDPLPAQDRLDTGARIVALARSTADATLELKGLFWQFVALTELGRLGAAESVLGTFERLAAATGSGGDVVMALSRHAMIAALRGRFDEVEAVTDEVVRLGMRFGVPDTRRLVATVRFGMVGWERADRVAVEAELGPVLAMARRFPGHFFEATAARMLTLVGRDAEAAAELGRVLPSVLAGSGPRWVAAMADLGHVAVVTGDTAAARRLYAALEPFAGRLVVWSGASTVWGSVSHRLGRLAEVLGRREEALVHLKAAAVLEEEIGALPALAHSQAALADLTGDEELRSLSARRTARDGAAAGTVGAPGRRVAAGPRRRGLVAGGGFRGRPAAGLARSALPAGAGLRPWPGDLRSRPRRGRGRAGRRRCRTGAR